MRPAYETGQLTLDGTVENEGVGDESDFYATPRWVTRAILKHLPRASSYLDPCCGTGEILAAIVDHNGGVVPRLYGIEIDPARASISAERFGRGVRLGDAFALTWSTADVTIQNPPFSKALPFVEAALERAQPCASTATLLRLAFLESAARIPFWERWRDSLDIYVFANRISFIGGTSDNSAYMWLVSGPGRGGRYFHLTDADPTKKRRS